MRALGLGDHQQVLLDLSRVIGVIIAAAIALRPLWRARGGVDAIRAIGLSLLAVVLLGPTVQPWYIAWPVIVLATIAEHRMRVLLIALSCVASFLGLPGAGTLVRQFGEANPFLIVLASIAMLLLLAIPLVIRVRRALHMTGEERLLGSPARRLRTSGWETYRRFG